MNFPKLWYACTTKGQFSAILSCIHKQWRLSNPWHLFLVAWATLPIIYMENSVIEGGFVTDFITDIYLCILVHKNSVKTYCSLGQAGFHSCFSHIIHYIRFYVTMAVADLGERLRGYSSIVATSRNTKDSLYWYKMHLNTLTFALSIIFTLHKI